MVYDLLLDSPALPGDPQEITLSQDYIVSADTITDSSDHPLVGRVYLPVLFQDQSELICEKSVYLGECPVQFLFIPARYDDIVGIPRLVFYAVEGGNETVKRFEIEIPAPL